MVIGHHLSTPFIKTTESYEVCRLGHNFGSTFTGTDRNGRAFTPHLTRLCGARIAAVAGFITKQCCSLICPRNKSDTLLLNFNTPKFDGTIVSFDFCQTEII